jgi:hypothetical protein
LIPVFAKREATPVGFAKKRRQSRLADTRKRQDEADGVFYAKPDPFDSDKWQQGRWTPLREFRSFVHAGP